ncbi:MAG: type II secretion system F family protein [Planctomycetota bacterium]
MPEFAYKALDRTGKSVAGVVSATDRAAAVALLGERDTFVTDMEENAGGVKRRNSAKTVTQDTGVSLRWNSRKVSPRQRLTLLRQLSVGLSAGLTLVNALEVVSDQADSPAVKALVADLIERVTAGDSLSEAEACHPEAFSTMQVSMTRAGEAAGALDSVMASLTAFAERDLELREKLRSAAIYPLMVLGLGFVSILVIMLFILPRIMTVVSESGGDLPLPTRILMGMTDWLRSPTGIGAMMIAVVAAGLWWRWSRTLDGALAMDRFKLKLPFIGTAIRRVSVSRFARTLGTLAAANIPIVESMRIVRDTLGNEALARDIDTAADGIVRGSSIADELRDTGQFPSLLIQVIAMGERTGRLDELLMDTADTYDKETNAALQRVMTIVPVLFILVLALFVAFILAAALLPIMGMDLGSGP